MLVCWTGETYVCKIAAPGLEAAHIPAHTSFPINVNVFSSGAEEGGKPWKPVWETVN